MQVSGEVEDIMSVVFAEAKNARLEYVTPELLLCVICQNHLFARAFESCGGSVEELNRKLGFYLDEYVGTCSIESQDMPEFSQSMGTVLAYAWEFAQGGGKCVVELSHIIYAIYELRESYACYYMQVQGVERAELLREMSAGCDEDGRADSACEGEDDSKKAYWRRYAVCLNDEVEDRNPLIGREEELERTMQILCRREKNNPLHIGEPGVGKTAITYGLARLLNEKRVCEPLLGAKIYSLDLAGLLAGTQYRGDLEKRFKKVMDSICLEEKPIIYIDEIHNVVGAGAVNGGTFDISNMLKPYLAAGRVRFIGATTYEEYKKHVEKNKSLVRRFWNMDILEPGIADTVSILEGLRERYEKFHGVTYDEGVLEYAAEMSAKYLNERFLPDKAIDLIDEAGAYRRMHPLAGGRQSVGAELIDEILSKVCHIPKQKVERDETRSLATLEGRLRRLVYGQDEAIAQAVNAVKCARAGLLEEGRPLASLLFVGPTGVGKTQIARSLAEELGIDLLRFDMSEYEEKHAVAKLIGAPAGYVGYEEGGLLTEEIRKHPHAVLLLDEIENGINLDYAEKIIQILEENCRDKHNQMIVTTHSPIFLDYVDKNNIRYMYREPNTGACRCSRLTDSDELNEKMSYLYPGELFMNMSNSEIIDKLLAGGNA